MRLHATDIDWAVGDGAEITGSIDAILPLLAGRTATLPRLTGQGAAHLAVRHPPLLPTTDSPASDDKP
ncbi:MAG: hypothetical protein M3143_08275 [Actinomycetota bacterium]|nr:hypothetical protein [Actinomycetota bacterium]